MDFTFSSVDQFVDFLFNASEIKTNATVATPVFPDWEVLSLNVQGIYGVALSINTKIVDTTGNNEYMTWKKLQGLVKAFLDQNSAVGSTIDIRMRAPQALSSQLDPNSLYSSFNLGFYSGADVISVFCTAVEKQIPADYTPAENWTLYIQGLITFWQANYNLNQQKSLQ